MGDLTYRDMRPEDLSTVARLLNHAFAVPPEGAKEWLASAGHEHMRVVSERPWTAPLACLLRIPMAQYFGGRSVPMLGIAGVAVAPEARGRGLARWMMRECIRRAREEGFALSGLYASTQSLYRQAGYEQAGHRFLIRVALSQIDVRDRGGPVTPLTDAEDSEIRACYAAFASRFDGMLDRGPYVWGRIRKFRDETYHGFGVRDSEGRLDGYVFLTQRRKPESGRHDVILSDLVFLNGAAGRRLLGFLADFQTIGDDLVFAAGPAHPALMLLGQQRYRIEFKGYWMIRVVDAAAALQARGYAGTGKVGVEIDDDLIEQNRGVWTVRSGDGAGRVERGGTADVRATACGLAALYSGFMSPGALALTGAVSGSPEGLQRAAGIFAGSTPWMTDFF